VIVAGVPTRQGYATFYYCVPLFYVPSAPRLKIRFLFCRVATEFLPNGPEAGSRWRAERGDVPWFSAEADRQIVLSSGVRWPGRVVRDQPRATTLVGKTDSVSGDNRRDR